MSTTFFYGVRDTGITEQMVQIESAMDGSGLGTDKILHGPLGLNVPKPNKGI